jgi:Restriction endonuclease/Topoisomerase DNA binding C4 zinc finger
MSRRQKSKEIALFEAITGLGTMGVVAFMFVPGFREMVQTGLLLGVIGVLIVVAVWLLTKFFKAEPSAGFKTIYAQTGAAPNPVRRRAPVVVVEPLRAAHKPSLSENLRKIDWFQFEKLMEIIYRHRGYSVKHLGGANPDGGVDLIVSRTNEKFIVQCKQWRKKEIGVKEMREFLGTLTDNKPCRGVYITLQGYTEDAWQLAGKHGIELLEETDLVKMLNEQGLSYSRDVSELFASKEKHCPKCGEKMVVRTAHKSGNEFWGCSTYPRCHYKMNYAAA